MSVANQVGQLECELAEVTKVLTALRDAVSRLPNAPPGFGNSDVDRVAWTAKFVKDNWSVRQEADEWKRRAITAERAVAACVLANAQNDRANA